MTSKPAMRYFQILYLMISTYFVGNLWGKLGNLKDSVKKTKRYHAWQRREVNKHMMYYLSSSDDPKRIDQYEFVLASLLNLGKISHDDVRPIMDKFRLLVQHSGDCGYIRVEDVPEEQDDDLSEELDEVACEHEQWTHSSKRDNMKRQKSNRRLLMVVERPTSPGSPPEIQIETVDAEVPLQQQEGNEEDIETILTLKNEEGEP